jgi:prepilin-type processing-associated H-X9-DG protein
MFPGQASEHSGFQASDWIWWRANDTIHPVQQSPIVIALADANLKLFRCPLDTDDNVRIDQAQADPANGPYLYSYGMTSFDPVDTGAVDANGNPRFFNPGMTSVFTGGKNLPFLLSSVRNPGGKIMIAEELASHSSLDNRTGQPDIKVINDGRWMPANNDPLSGRHGGKADVTFADFHVETETWEFGDNITNSQPDL